MTVLTIFLCKCNQILVTKLVQASVLNMILKIGKPDLQQVLTISFVSLMKGFQTRHAVQ